MLDENLTVEDKALAMKRMAKLETVFVPAKAGDINEKIESPHLANKDHLESEFNAARSSNSTNDWGCCH